MYFPFYPGWWRGCRPVSRSIFALTPVSAAQTVPTCTYFPRLWLPFLTRTANHVATLVLVCKSTSSKALFNSEGVSIGTPEPPKLFRICRNHFHYPIVDAFFPNSEITFVLNTKERRKPCQER